MYAKPLVLFLLALLGLGVSTAWTQSRSELERRRKALLEDIERTNRELSSTQKDRQTALARYLTLQNQIRNREQLMLTLDQEIEYMTNSIERANIAVEALDQDLARLKSEYADALRTAYRHKMASSFLVFLLSSDGFNEAFRRWQYIRQYEKYRRRQADAIAQTQQTLANKVNMLVQQKADKQQLLQDYQTQQLMLAGELRTKNDLLRTLRQDEKRLAGQLAQQQQAHERLNRAIEEVIRAEMAARKSNEKTEAGASARAADLRLSANFQDNRGRLPWPVSQGRITRFFGTQPHPKLKAVKIDNNGIDIQVKGDPLVRSVFSGTVVSTSFIPGYKNTVIVKHGDFYSVYSNLDVVKIKRGTDLRGGELIGRLSEADPLLHFEIWKEKSRMNPQDWLRAP